MLIIAQVLSVILRDVKFVADSFPPDRRRYFYIELTFYVLSSFVVLGYLLKNLLGFMQL